jgi:methyltransferase
VIQRLSEVVISERHEKILKAKYNASEASASDSIIMKLFHVSWFACWGIEALYCQHLVGVTALSVMIAVLVFCQMVRLETMNRLGEFWSIKVYKMNSRPIIRQGIYKHLRHPNYSIVFLELFLVPLIFHSYITAVVFTVTNIFIIKHRIQMEESALEQQGSYSYYFANIKKLIPYIY